MTIGEGGGGGGKYANYNEVLLKDLLQGLVKKWTYAFLVGKWSVNGKLEQWPFRTHPPKKLFVLEIN